MLGPEEGKGGGGMVFGVEGFEDNSRAGMAVGLTEPLDLALGLDLDLTIGDWVDGVIGVVEVDGIEVLTSSFVLGRSLITEGEGTV